MKSSQRPYLKSRVSSVVPLYLTAECLLLPGQRNREKQGIKDSQELFFKDMMRAGKNKNNPDVVKAFVKTANEQYDFILNKLKLQS